MDRIPHNDPEIDVEYHSYTYVPEDPIERRIAPTFASHDDFVEALITAARKN